jgi:hypothetical protein
MLQKTKNRLNQGSIDKKFDFFLQSLSHIPRWVHLVKKRERKILTLGHLLNKSCEHLYNCVYVFPQQNVKFVAEILFLILKMVIILRENGTTKRKNFAQIGGNVNAGYFYNVLILFCCLPICSRVRVHPSWRVFTASTNSVFAGDYMCTEYCIST